MRPNRNRRRERRPAPRIVVAFLLALACAPLAAQFGDIGLSGVGARRFANEDLLFFDPENGDQFARALAAGDFNGDGSDDLATGIPLDDGIFDFSPNDCGAVFVRYGSPGSGLATSSVSNFLGQFLAGSPDVAEAGDAFGFALAACDFNDDGYDDLAVGVPNEDGLAVNSGAIQIYYGLPQGLGADIELIDQSTPGVPGEPEPNDFFGLSLACGDLNGDTYADLAIGVPWETIEAEDAERAGVVQVVFGSPGGLDASTSMSVFQQTPGLGGTPETNDLYGWAIAIGNFNSDGADDLAVGIPGEDGPVLGQGQGAVMIVLGGTNGGFPGHGGTMTEATFGQPREDGDRFGDSLAAGDFDGNLYDDLVIGVPFEDDFGGVDVGQVIVKLNGPTFRFQVWSEVAIHGSGASEQGDRFGYSLTTGDFDGDGLDDLAIGTPGESISVSEDGMVTVVMGSEALGIDASRRHGLAAGRDGNPGVANQANRQHGYAITAGDFDADGFADLAIGAPFEDENGRFDVGSEVVFYGSLFGANFDNGDTGYWSLTAP